MLDVPVYNIEGEQIDTLKVDEGTFGGTVNVDLLKQAVVTYHANRRQGSAANRSRGLVSGTTAKAFRQKGTGRARRGDLRTNLLRGGGVAFRKDPRSFRKRLPKKMRRRALRSALLAKMLSNDLVVLDGLAMEAPRTRTLADVLGKLQIHRSCLLALPERDTNIHLSARNIPDLTVRITEELNAFDVATRQKMVVTAEAMAQLTAAPAEEEVPEPQAVAAVVAEPAPAAVEAEQAAEAPAPEQAAESVEAVSEQPPAATSQPAPDPEPPEAEPEADAEAEEKPEAGPAETEEADDAPETADVDKTEGPAKAGDEEAEEADDAAKAAAESADDDEAKPQEAES